MDEKQREIMLIAQEESAEVIQAISKVFRFGPDNYHPDGKKTNNEHLAEEIGDLFCMIELMIERGMVDPVLINKASLAKRDKLQKWSKIFWKKDENFSKIVLDIYK